MTFIDERLPVEIERNSEYGLGFKSSVFEMHSGFEKRNEHWSLLKGKGNIGYSIQDADNLKVVRDHHIAVAHGRVHTFPFKDWFDYKVGDPDDAVNTKQTIALGDDATTTFQFFKAYAFGSSLFARPIVLPILTTVRAWRDASELTRVASSPSAGEFSITRPGGIIETGDVFASTGGTGPGGEEILAMVAEYDNYIRYNTDRIMPTLEWEEVGSMPDIPIFEVRYTAP